MSSYEGKQESIRTLQTPVIEVFRNIYAEQDYRIDIEISEFSAICPKTGLPDYGRIFVSYKPKDYCIELKSLKEYCLFYRELGIFQENVANRIRSDLIKAASPRWLRILADYNTRGGIKTKVRAVYCED